MEHANGQPMVSPYTGEWIEICALANNKVYKDVSPYTGEWIEILISHNSFKIIYSLTLHR